MKSHLFAWPTEFSAENHSKATSWGSNLGLFTCELASRVITWHDRAGLHPAAWMDAFQNLYFNAENGTRKARRTAIVCPVWLSV